MESGLQFHSETKGIRTYVRFFTMVILPSVIQTLVLSRLQSIRTMVVRFPGIRTSSIQTPVSEPSYVQILSIFMLSIPRLSVSHVTYRLFTGPYCPSYCSLYHLLRIVTCPQATDVMSSHSPVFLSHLLSSVRESVCYLSSSKTYAS